MNDKGGNHTCETSEHNNLYYIHRRAWLWVLLKAGRYQQLPHSAQFCISATQHAAAGRHLAKLMARSGSCVSSSSRCLSAMDCILMSCSLVACSSVRTCGAASSPCRSRDCTDSRKRVYRLFLSASAQGETRREMTIGDPHQAPQGRLPQHSLRLLGVLRVHHYCFSFTYVTARLKF